MIHCHKMNLVKILATFSRGMDSIILKREQNFRRLSNG